jgi:putative flippase GtrA
VYLCGRLAEYKYYNMDACLANALELAEQIKQKSGGVNLLRLAREIILYGIIGLSCASLDSVVFMLLRKTGVNLYAANFTGMNLGMLSSFLLNTFINFKTKDRLKLRAVQFFAVGYCGLLLSMGIMYLGVQVLNITEIAVKISSVFIIAAFQFTLNKLFTFKRSRYG